MVDTVRHSRTGVPIKKKNVARMVTGMNGSPETVGRRQASDRVLTAAYLAAKEHVIAAGFGKEIDWQYGVSVHCVTEQDFLREAGWVVLCSGMREMIIRRCFNGVSEAFFGWISANAIVRNSDVCRTRALEIFRHAGKIGAILAIAGHVDKYGFDEVIRELVEDPIPYLRQLPYLGPATARHLAKNLGVPVVKPDRHLCRIAQATGFVTPEALCAALGTALGEPIGVVDLVLWRFATLRCDYLKWFTSWEMVGSPLSQKFGSVLA